MNTVATIKRNSDDPFAYDVLFADEDDVADPVYKAYRIQTLSRTELEALTRVVPHFFRRRDGEKCKDCSTYDFCYPPNGSKSGTRESCLNTAYLLFEPKAVSEERI